MNSSPLNSEAASTKISPGAPAQDNHIVMRVWMASSDVLDGATCAM